MYGFADNPTLTSLLHFCLLKIRDIWISYRYTATKSDSPHNQVLVLEEYSCEIIKPIKETCNIVKA